MSQFPWLPGILAPGAMDFAVLAGGLILLLALALVLGAFRQRRSAIEHARALDERMAEIGRQGAELSGRLATMAEILASRQSDLARLVADRLDNVGTRVGQGLEASTKSTSEHLARLGERLAVIDAAQTRLTGLSQDIVGLKDILANKQSRGAFGQARMEAIIRDALPQGGYEFQHRLSNDCRPDAVIRLPGDSRLMVIDAKFPLEGFTALHEAKDEDTRQIARQRVRNDVGRHIRDIAAKYFVPGETQDIAMLFVPSETIFGDLVEHFDDVLQKAHRAQIILVSPSLMMMAVQVMQSIVRDARMRDEAHVIQKEVRNLLDDVTRLHERVVRLDSHFRQAQEDVAQITTSVEKIMRRGMRIDQMDFAPAQGGAQPELPLRAAGE